MDGESDGCQTDQEKAISVFGAGSPGAPGLAGDCSRHGQAQMKGRLQAGHTAAEVSERRHFSLRKRREQCQ